MAIFLGNGLNLGYKNPCRMSSQRIQLCDHSSINHGATPTAIWARCSAVECGEQLHRLGYSLQKVLRMDQVLTGMTPSPTEDIGH